MQVHFYIQATVNFNMSLESESTLQARIQGQALHVPRYVTEFFSRLCWPIHMNLNTHCPRGWPETSRGRWLAAFLQDGWPLEGEVEEVRCVWEL